MLKCLKEIGNYIKFRDLLQLNNAPKPGPHCFQAVIVIHIFILFLELQFFFHLFLRKQILIDKSLLYFILSQTLP